MRQVSDLQIDFAKIVIRVKEAREKSEHDAKRPL